MEEEFSSQMYRDYDVLNSYIVETGIEEDLQRVRNIISDEDELSVFNNNTITLTKEDINNNLFITKDVIQSYFGGAIEETYNFITYIINNNILK